MTCELKEEHRVPSVHLQCHAAVRLPLPPWEWSYKHYWKVTSTCKWLSSLITLRCMCLHSIYLLMSVYFLALLLFVSILCKDIYYMFVRPGGGILFLLFFPPDEGSFMGRRKESLRINAVACCTDCKAVWEKIVLNDFEPYKHNWLDYSSPTDVWHLGWCWYRYYNYWPLCTHSPQRSLTYGF